MITPTASILLQIWEHGASQSAPVRARLLLGAAFPERTAEELGEISIGEQDASLLTLRQQMFGPQLECLTRCSACGEQIELRFRVADVRAEHAEAGVSHRLQAEECDVHFRVPCGADLVALAAGDRSGTAVSVLLSRCVLEARIQNRLVPPAELPQSVIALLDQRMSELDAQAQVELDIACPGCGRPARTTFDIVTHLWEELDAWARTCLAEVHGVASYYGWSEAEILGLSALRRRVYLDLIEA